MKGKIYFSVFCIDEAIDYLLRVGERERKRKIRSIYSSNNHDVNIEARPKFIFLPLSQFTLLICMFEGIIAKPFCQCRFVIGADKSNLLVGV